MSEGMRAMQCRAMECRRNADNQLKEKMSMLHQHQCLLVG